MNTDNLYEYERGVDSDDFLSAMISIDSAADSLCHLIYPDGKTHGDFWTEGQKRQVILKHPHLTLGVAALAMFAKYNLDYLNQLVLIRVQNELLAQTAEKLSDIAESLDFIAASKPE